MASVPPSTVQPYNADNVGVTGLSVQSASTTPLLVTNESNPRQATILNNTVSAPQTRTQQTQQTQQVPPTQIPTPTSPTQFFFPSSGSTPQPNPPTPVPTQPQQNQVQNVTQEVPVTDDASEWVRQTFGMNTDELRTFVQSMQGMIPVLNQVQQQQTQQAISQLRETWNVDEQGLQFRMNVVQQYLNTLDPASRNAYEMAGVHGAQLLWQQAIAANPSILQHAPSMERSSSMTTQNGQSYGITMSQLIDMDEEEYVRRQPELMDYMDRGAVLMDV